MDFTLFKNLLLNKKQLNANGVSQSASRAPLVISSNSHPQLYKTLWETVTIAVSHQVPIKDILQELRNNNFCLQLSAQHWVSIFFSKRSYSDPSSFAHHFALGDISTLALKSFMHSLLDVEQLYLTKENYDLKIQELKEVQFLLHSAIDKNHLSTSDSAGTASTAASLITICDEYKEKIKKEFIKVENHHKYRNADAQWVQECKRQLKNTENYVELLIQELTKCQLKVNAKACSEKDSLLIKKQEKINHLSILVDKANPANRDFHKKTYTTYFHSHDTPAYRAANQIYLLAHEILCAHKASPLMLSDEVKFKNLLEKDFIPLLAHYCEEAERPFNTCYMAPAQRAVLELKNQKFVNDCTAILQTLNTIHSQSQLIQNCISDIEYTSHYLKTRTLL